MGNLLAELQRKREVLWIFVIPALGKLGCWQAVESVVYFGCTKVFSVIREILFLRKVFGIEQPLPFLVGKPGRADQDVLRKVLHIRGDITFGGKRFQTPAGVLMVLKIHSCATISAERYSMSQQRFDSPRRTCV